MGTFSVVETFVSINGEGPHAGELALFLRFQGCNLACSFCDTKWANTDTVPTEQRTVEQLVQLAQQEGVHSITLTGGEPLLQPDIAELITALCALGYHVEIETNGSVPLAPFTSLAFRPSFTMDYKLSCSGMESHMLPENFACLTMNDSVKFVVGSRSDLERAVEVVTEHGLTARCPVYFSPVFGSIQPAEIVDFMKERNLNRVRLQLQLHKYIWDPQKRGV